MIATVAYGWGRVGRLNISSARGNSPTGLCQVASTLAVGGMQAAAS